MDTNKDIKKKAKETMAAPVERLVYCGPNIPGGALRQYTVFKGGLPQYAQEVIERCPAVTELFVAPAVLDQARADIGKNGTGLNTAYKEVQAHFRKGEA